MSTGTIKQFVDFTASGDNNQNEADAIEPIENGENVTETVTNRPAENLRVRSEAIRGILEDLLYLADADRHIFVGGPGTVAWPGVAPGNTGIFTLSDSVYIIPALTPGYAQTPPVPPVASAYGTLTLAKAGGAAGLILTSRRRSYAGGDRINVTVVEGTPLAVTAEVDGRTVTVTTPSTATLDEVRVAINALTADTPATQLLTAVVDGGALGTDLIDSTQVQQFISGNYDGEGHTIVPANLATFFAADGGANVLREGDSLCVWYAYLRDPAAPPTYGGRRESIPENTNTAIPAGSFFNSRVHPERLVDALPIAKVINGYLCFINGLNVPLGATGVSFNNSTYNGGSAWYDGTTNPATTFEAQLDKIITDLIATTTAHSGADKLGCAARTDWLGGTTKANVAASIFAAINKIVTDLALNAAATDDGSIRLGAAAVTDLAQGSVRSQLTTLAADWAKLARINSFTALQNLTQTTFNSLVDTEANARLPRVEGAVAFYTLLAKWNVTDQNLRVYARANGYLYVTWNAYWTGTEWYADGPSGGPYQASRIVFKSNGTLDVDVYSSATRSWDDATWDTGFSLDRFRMHIYRIAQITNRSDVSVPLLEVTPTANARGDMVNIRGPLVRASIFNHFGYHQFCGAHIKEEFFKLDPDLWVVHEGSVSTICTVDNAITGRRHVLKAHTPTEVGVHAILAPMANLHIWDQYFCIQFKIDVVEYGGSGGGGIYFGLGDDGVAPPHTDHFALNWRIETGNVMIDRQGLASVDTGISIASLLLTGREYFTLGYTSSNTLSWWISANEHLATDADTGSFSVGAMWGGPRIEVVSIHDQDHTIYCDFLEMWGGKA